MPSIIHISSLESKEFTRRATPYQYVDESTASMRQKPFVPEINGEGNHCDSKEDSRDRVLETRTDLQSKITRDYKATERDGIIDLTDEGIDYVYQSDGDQPNYETALRENEDNIDLPEQSEMPLPEVRLLKTKIQEKAANLEQRRNKLKERLVNSKGKMEKLGSLLKIRSRKDEKTSNDTAHTEGPDLIKSRNSCSNSLIQGDSVNTQREPLSVQLSRKTSSARSTPTREASPTKNVIPEVSRPDPLEDRSDQVSLRQSGSATETRLKEPPGHIIVEDGSADPVFSARTESTPEPTPLDIPTDEVVAEAKPSQLDNTAIADTTESNEGVTDDHVDSGCNWYICSDQRNRTTSNAEKEIVERNEVANVVSENKDPSLWGSILYWIDPAPTMLVETLKERWADDEETVLTETTLENALARDLKFGAETMPPNSAVATRASETPALFQSPDTGDEADDAEEVDEDKELDQDSGTVSDAGLNSMPPMEEKVMEGFSINSLPQKSVSAFDVVKPSTLSPAASMEMSPLENDDDRSRTIREDDDTSRCANEDDASSVDASETKIFADDLKSIPSVKEDLTEGVSELQPDDLGSEMPLPDSPSIARTMDKVRKKEAKKMESKMAYQSKADESLEARRHALVKELRTAIATYGRYDIRCAKITADLGDVLDQGGDHVHAVRLHKDATTIYSCKLGDDHSTTMDAKMRLGAVLENANQYDEAIGMYYLVTVMRRALHGENDPSVGDGLVQMAQTLRKKADYFQAIKELKRALKVYRESLGDTNEKVANTVDQIASLYVTVGDFDKSSAILEEVVKLKAATMGMSSKPVAQTLSTLATTYECSEKFNGAMKALKKAYKIYTEIGGYSSEDSTNTLNRIAQLYEATGDQNRAAIAYLGVLRARKVLLGADSLPVGETYYRLGHSLRETGQFDKSLKCLKEALPIFVGQGVEMNDMKMVADIMHEMAFINQDKGNLQDAVRIFKQELSVRRKLGQSSFPLIARTLNHLGVAEFQLQNNTKALKHLVEALTIFQERGEQGIECAEVLFNTGLVFEAVQNKERALEAYTEARRIFLDRGYEEEHPHLKKVAERTAMLTSSQQV